MDIHLCSCLKLIKNIEEIEIHRVAVYIHTKGGRMIKYARVD